jgi:hypothetical protein
VKKDLLLMLLADRVRSSAIRRAHGKNGAIPTMDMVLAEVPAIMREINAVADVITDAPEPRQQPAPEPPLR